MLLPNIAITSYLGSSKEVRKVRLECHLRQRKKIKHLFPDLKILSICSDYTSKEKKFLDRYDCLFLKKRTHKYVKHNLIFEELYKSKHREEAVLLLDDDVFPLKEWELPLCSTSFFVNNILKRPYVLPAACMYFSCAHLFFDAYNKARIRKEGSIVTAPLQVCGWAMWVRSDLGVVYTDETCIEPETGLVLDDMPFRCKCYAEGKRVLKHLGAYFDSYQWNTKRVSSFFDSEDSWRQTIKVHTEYLLKKHPNHFMKVRGKVRFKKNHSKGFDIQP